MKQLRQRLSILPEVPQRMLLEWINVEPLANALCFKNEFSFKGVLKSALCLSEQQVNNEL